MENTTGDPIRTQSQHYCSTYHFQSYGNWLPKCLSCIVKEVVMLQRSRHEPARALLKHVDGIKVDVGMSSHKTIAFLSFGISVFMQFSVKYGVSLFLPMITISFVYFQTRLQLLRKWCGMSLRSIGGIMITRLHLVGQTNSNHWAHSHLKQEKISHNLT